MPKSRSSNTIATRSSGAGAGGSGMGSGGGMGGPLEEVEMAQRLQDRLNDVTTVTVDVPSRTRGGTEEVQVTFDPNSPGTATVESASGSTYQVDYNNDECNCMHYRVRRNGCRHIDAANIAAGQIMGDRDVSNERTGQAIASVENAVSQQTNLDREAEEDRRALTRDMEDDGYFYSDHQEEFEQTMERLRNEPLPYEYENVLNGNDITFGIELEFVDGDSDAIARDLHREGICAFPQMVPYRTRGVSGKWKLERDGSVTSGSRGGELVSPVLKDTPETWRTIETVCEIAKRHGGTINYQCGGHVHVGMDQLDTARQRWRRFFRSIEGNEESIYRFAGGGEGRIRSGHRSYAQSFEEYASHGARMRFTMNDEDDVRSLASRVSTSRYKGINLTNISRHGRPDTVEFRYFNGSLSPGQIQANIKLAAGVMNSCEKARTQDGDTYTVSESMKRRGRAINDTTNRRNARGLMKFVDSFFTRKKDKDHIIGVLAKNNWR